MIVSTILGLIGIALSLIGGTAFMMSRGRPGIDWENPGWKSGLVYSFGLIPWSLAVIIFIELYEPENIALGIIYQTPALLAVIFITISIWIRKNTSEDRDYTSIPTNRNGSIRHSRSCVFFYLLALLSLNWISMTLMVF